LSRLLRRLPSLAALVTVAWLAATLLAAAGHHAHAQTCSSDAQCRDNGRPRTVCAGNTLVTKQTICAGTCRTMEVSRVPCPGPCVADRCVGGSLRSSPAVPSAGGGGLPSGVCGQLCSCSGKRLTYGIGYAQRTADCQRRTVDCVYGCSCDGEPRCLKKTEVRQ
jgi:hypothetical protein